MKATWRRDAQGIPQISSDDIPGLCWGMGYCHAMDRGMQMLLMRILGWGRAAELLADTDEMLEIDRFFRRHNFSAAIDDQIALLDSDSRAAVEAYCDGVNARLREKVPLEFKLVGYSPTPWTLGDSLMMTRMVGFLTLAQSQGEVERLFVEMVQANVPDGHLEALFPGSTTDLERELLSKVVLGERIVPDLVRWAAAGARMMASNNWCIAGAKTRSGKAILANDPHLETNRLPNVWAEQSFRWPGGYVIAATMPGLPAPLVGRNEHVAWGATYTFMDAIDSWVEEVENGKYRRGDEWHDFERRDELVRRKKSDSVELTFYENDHGVLDGDASVDGFYMATRWSGARSGARSIEAIHRMWTVTSVEEGMAAYAEVEPSFNWIFADDAGNIGYQMSGNMPVRDERWNGFAPRPGSDATWDWKGFVEGTRLPRALNPDDGLIVTANQDLNDLGDADPINMPMGDYRARRIRSLLEDSDQHDVESCRAIQMDVYSIQAAQFFPILEPLLDDGPLATAILGWDFQYDVDSRGADAFERFYRSLLVEMFGPDCGTSVIEHLQDATGIFIDFYQNFDRILLAESSPWHGDRTREAIWRRAFERVAGESPRRWGDVNRLTLTNIFFNGALPGILGFDKGPLELAGGRATPLQGQIYKAGERVTSFTPSLRFVVDFAEPDLHSSLCGGPSDRRLSKWYTSGVSGWLEGSLVRRSPND